MDPTTQPKPQPDEAPLPPHVVLPDEREFRLGQWWARLVVAGIALALVLLIHAASPQLRHVTLPCALLIAAAFLFAAVRYLVARFTRTP